MNAGVRGAMISSPGKFLAGIALLWIGLAVTVTAWAADWDAFRELKGSHFVVRYLLEDERATASTILERAERYYRRLAEDVGYDRYHEYWTWERRVSIVYYPDELSFKKFTVQPKWSKGFATRDSMLFHTKAIISFDGQPDFLDKILPHEIAHLILWDYLGFASKVPVWFQEGVAQIEETPLQDEVQRNMQGVVVAGNAIPFVTLMSLNSNDINQDGTQVSLFYAQSLSVVKYMIDKYGRESFRTLCRELRSGKDFETALTGAYPAVFSSLADLERKWKTYLQNELF